MLGKCAPPTRELPDTWFLSAPPSPLGERNSISTQEPMLEIRTILAWEERAPLPRESARAVRAVHHSHAGASFPPAKHEAHCCKYAPLSHGSARELPAKFRQLYKSARRQGESSLHALNIFTNELCEALAIAWKVRPSHRTFPTLGFLAPPYRPWEDRIFTSTQTPCWKYAPFSHGKNVHHSHAAPPR